MESNFSNRDFERFVKQSADQYRMFPSEKVWKGVNSVLHTRKKWYGVWLSVLLLLSGGAVTWVMTSYPSTDRPVKTSLINKNSNLPKSPAVVQNIDNLFTLDKPAVVSSSVATVQEDPIIPGFASPLTREYRRLPEISNDIAVFPTVDMLSTDNSLFNADPLSAFVLPQENVIAEKFPATGEDRQSRAIAAIPNYFTIESIVNAYQYKKIPKKISWQLFVTPTVSYRKLSTNKSFDNPASSNYPFAYRSDVNSVVTHKPDLGLQVGIAGRYPITKSVNLRGGFQFNINRYDIKALAFKREIATIDLNGGTGNNTISTWTNYRNIDGYSSDWLKNFYFSFSLPVGVELKLFGNEKTNVGVAGTLQPTYMLSDEAYLISTDYQNYAEVPRLIRHVNLNTSFETFVNYTRGNTKWQIGPQVRYQLLSSFQSTYPVKENLFDFGIKMGVTLSK